MLTLSARVVESLSNEDVAWLLWDGTCPLDAIVLFTPKSDLEQEELNACESLLPCVRSTDRNDLPDWLRV